MVVQHHAHLVGDRSQRGVVLCLVLRLGPRLRPLRVHDDRDALAFGMHRGGELRDERRERIAVLGRQMLVVDVDPVVTEVVDQVHDRPDMTIA